MAVLWMQLTALIVRVDIILNQRLQRNAWVTAQMELWKTQWVEFASVVGLAILVLELSQTVLLVLIILRFYMIMPASVIARLKLTQQGQLAYPAKMKIVLTALQANANNVLLVIFYTMDFVLNPVQMELTKLRMTIPVAYAQQVVRYV